MAFFVGKDLKTAKKIGNLMAQRAGYMLLGRSYFAAGKPVLIEGNMVNYGKVDALNAPIELIYDYSTEFLIGTNEQIEAIEFVADQYAVMKNKYEERSTKVGPIARLQPQRALMRGDLIYDNHINTLIDVFIEDLFSDSREMKVVTFYDFCKHFIRFIKETRTVANHRGLAVSKSLFYMSAAAPINVSGLVIDFEVDDYHDDAKKQMMWMEDPNFDLYCSMANYAGFYVDIKHPYRIIANLADPKMQRAAEYTSGSTYDPGSASDILQKYYFKTCRHEFLILKNKLFEAWAQICYNRPIIKLPSYCKSGKIKITDIRREALGLSKLVVPPLPGRPTTDPNQLFGADKGNEYKRSFDVNDSSIVYGYHNKKYDLFYWMKFYVEVRYHEIALIKENLTEKEKNGILKSAFKIAKKGNIDRAFEFIGAHFDRWTYLNH